MELRIALEAHRIHGLDIRMQMKRRFDCGDVSEFGLGVKRDVSAERYERLCRRRDALQDEWIGVFLGESINGNT